MPTQPTLINLPPPPSDPVTPSDIPGTPNSATTSMSELSTVAIKDGHRGHLPHASRNAPQPDAERADRISRLAGLERVATARQPTPVSSLTPGVAAPPSTSYFDAAGNPLLPKERSTVGSASATGSVGGRTTWASGSVSDVGDKMSDAGDGMEVDVDRSSVGGGSDDGGLVGFGEGARTPARSSAAYASPLAGKNRGESLTPTSSQAALQEVRDARMIDGLARDGIGAGPGAVEGRQVAERIVNQRIGADGGLESRAAAGGAGLGRFDFEGK
ncbi:hypothetical protein K461DRAFT_232492 [Myriangium duriaei CBS 260.36]|uniref:Uncharacterized protein n=1 Tax=Myriangium duriaei CBS 260.36 TaxID=1168546 RepID=A0A9P4IW95_9PEZI|nr:hypothetical protein K461DRAFT_232492 [Myriangium duriaei CBS 260.36]